MQEIHNVSWLKLVWAKGRWYLVSSLFTKGLNLLLLPLYTRYLSPSGFGELNTLLSMVQILAIAISLYLDAAFARYFHEYKYDHERLRALFSTAYWFVLGWGTFVLLVTLSTVPYWVRHFASVPMNYIVLAFVPALFAQIAQLGLVFLRQSLDTRRTTALDIAAAVISTAVTVPLLVVWHWGVQARLVGLIFPAVFLFLYYTWYFRSRGLLGPVFEIPLLQECLVYSIPLIPNVASGWISGMSDRLVLAKYADMSAVGLYSLAASLATLLYVLQDAITQVTCAATMSGLVKDRVATIGKLEKLSFVLWGIMLTADLGLAAFSREFVWVFTTKAYADAAAVVGIYALVYVLAPQYRIFSDIISYHRKTWVISTAAVLMAVLSLLLNLALVPRFGYISAAYTFVLATLVYTAWIYFWCRRYEAISLPWTRMATLLLAFAGSYAASQHLQDMTLINWFAKLVLILCFIGLFFVLARSHARRVSASL